MKKMILVLCSFAVVSLINAGCPYTAPAVVSTQEPVISGEPATETMTDIAEVEVKTPAAEDIEATESTTLAPAPTTTQTQPGLLPELTSEISELEKTAEQLVEPIEQKMESMVQPQTPMMEEDKTTTIPTPE